MYTCLLMVYICVYACVHLKGQLHAFNSNTITGFQSYCPLHIRVILLVVASPTSHLFYILKSSSSPIPGLFHKAVLQSGSPTAFWSSHNSSVDLETHVRIIAKAFHCNQPLKEDIALCLRQLSWRLLAVAPFQVRDDVEL